MRTHIVRIGNSRGVRIPKALLEQAGFEKEGAGDSLPEKVRDGWAESFAEMRKNGDDCVWDEGDVVTNSWDEEEWDS